MDEPSLDSTKAHILQSPSRGSPEKSDRESQHSLAQLDAQLSRWAETHPEGTHSEESAASLRNKQNHTGLGVAARMGTDLLAGVIVCVLIALAVVEWWLPEYRMLILALGSLCGIGIGLYNVWRNASQTLAKPQTFDKVVQKPKGNDQK